MDSNAINAQDTKISIGDGTDYTEILDVKSFSGFDGQADEIDVTTLRSKAKEKRMGLQDFGGISLDLNIVFDDPGQLQLQEAKASQKVKQFKVEFTNGTTAKFDGLVRSYTIDGSVNGVLTGKSEIMITGEAVFTPAE